MKLLYNANIYTLDADLPHATALVIDGERLVAVGDSETLHTEFGGRSQVFDLGGRTVIPGLTDAHLHLEYYALGLQKVNCETATRAECLERVAQRARSTPPGQWILGHGWNQNNWREGFGSAADLDTLAPSQPVYLTAKSLHAAWVNSAALRLANITAATPDPPDGKLGRKQDGSPDGILFESAMQLVAGIVPEPTIEQVIQALHTAQPVLWAMGLTGVHDFDRQRCFSALQTLHQRGELRLRVLKSIPVEDLPHAAALGLRSGFGDNYLRIGGVKVFADGALGPQTAAMFQSYEGNPENRGMLMVDAEELFEYGRQAVDSGLSVAVHAIGDRANHEVLNAFENLRRYEQQLTVSRAAPAGHALRHRIEHVQVLHPNDLHRLAQLGIIASMQPIHAISDMSMADRYWGARSALSYAWRSQLTQGAILAFGSDAPVDSPNPFWGLHAAVTRRRQDGTPAEEGWYPEQRLTLHEGLHAYTTGAAYAAGMEAHLGKLFIGYMADLLVLEKDPFTVTSDELYRMQPQATMVGGEWVHGGVA